MEIVKQFVEGALSGIETFVSLIFHVPFWIGWALVISCLSI
jgi:hypothetical protein